jgi:two-component system, OmpR family, response regulator ChvI
MEHKNESFLKPSLDINIQDEEVCFYDRTREYCVCFADIVNSTKVIAKIADSKKIRSYYMTFLNTAATVARGFGACIIKNVGDGLLFYFPETSDCTNKQAFEYVLECCTTLTASHDIINIKMHSQDLPSISYRISADYGVAEVATSASSNNDDLFGPTMNICAKINSLAAPNGIVVGGDLFRILNTLSLDKDYYFEEIKRGYSVGLKQTYPVYALTRKNNVSVKSLASLFKGTHKLESIGRAHPHAAGTGNVEEPSLDAVVQKQQDVSHKNNIMLIDDEPDMLFTYKSFLEYEGYNVDVFTDPVEALQYYAKLQPSYYKLVILDIRMPCMNGLQLYQRLQAINPNIRGLFVSALDAVEELVSILPGVNSDDILKKPVQKNIFLGSVKRKCDLAI